MGNNDTNERIGLIRKLINQEESNHKSLLMENSLDDISDMINTKLMSLVEFSTYPFKYRIIKEIDNANYLLNFYSNLPFLINKCIIGCPLYMGESFYAQYLKKYKIIEYLSEKDNCISSKIPTLLVGTNEPRPPYVYTTSNNIIRLDYLDYQTILKCEYSDNKSEQIDLSSIISYIIIFSNKIDANKVFLFYPYAEENKVDKKMLSLMDALVINDNMTKSKDILKYISDYNIKTLYVGEKSKKYTKVDSHFQINTILADIRNIFFDYERTYSNFNIDQILTSSLSELLWYHSEELKIYNERIQMENEVCLFLEKDGIAWQEIKRKCNDDKEQFSDTQKIVDSIITILEKICDKYIELKKIIGINNELMSFDSHAFSDQDIMGCLYRLRCINNSIDSRFIKIKVNEFAELCKKNADSYITSIINESKTDKNVISVLKNKNIKNPFLKKFLIVEFGKWGCSDYECGKLVESIKNIIPISPWEQRMLGEYYLHEGRIREAKDELLVSLCRGDAEAGNVLVRDIYLEEEELKEIAKFGVGSSAIKLGKLQLERYEEGVDRTNESFISASKYLNVAAAMGEPFAESLLGDLWYSRANFAKYKEEEDNYLDIALQHYLNAEESPISYEKLGVTTFRQKNYKTAKNYLSKAGTAKAHYLLGRIFEKGLGVSVDVDKARKEYRLSVDLGYSKAKKILEDL